MNDSQSFAQVYEDFQPQLRRFLVARLGNEADADDVVQDSFVKFQKAMESGSVENPKALLFSIARNQSVDVIRRNSRAKVREAAYGDTRYDRADDDLVDPEPSAETRVMAREDIKQLADALDHLSPKVRQAFVLHKIEGLPYVDVAKKMGIAKSTVEKHLIKALKVLSEALGR